MKTSTLLPFVAALCAVPALGRQTDIAGPPGSVRFGEQVQSLPNGNFVVVDTGADADRGAVHLYAGSGARISTLRGASAGDRLGSGGVIVLPSGNFIVCNPSSSFGGATNAGSATWVNGRAGLDATVSAQNSLVGTHADDKVGRDCRALRNGNYVVMSHNWSRDVAGTLAANAGAVSWGSALAGVAGAVSPSNSLVGRSADDHVGDDAIELANGHVVVPVPYWSRGAGAHRAGAVVWMDGARGVRGEVGAGNALLGSHADDHVGSQVVPLVNGSYYVVSELWSDGHAQVGAFTWCSGAGACLGDVSAGNSLVGTGAYDFWAARGLALPNGKLLALLPNWSEPVQGIAQAGAATVLPAGRSRIGPLDPGAVLHGAQSGDRVGEIGLLLDDGNAVVASSSWHDGAGSMSAAISFFDANAPATGTVWEGNALIAHDSLGLGVVPLVGGRYVVACPYCDIDGVQDAGAVVWADHGGATGRIDSGNSLHGKWAGDNVGGQVVALDNGHYVVVSPEWANSFLYPGQGAVTWVDGSTGVPKNESTRAAAVSRNNSLTGNFRNDFVGDGGVTALPGGNYAIVSRLAANGLLERAGAVTWADGGEGLAGVVDAANSLIGTSTDDRLGSVALSTGGHLVVGSNMWNERLASGGIAANVGAVTWIDGRRGLRGAVTAENSLLGAQAGDGAGLLYADEVPDGDYVVWTPFADACTPGGACVPDVGAWTLAPGSRSTHGRIGPHTSLYGTVANEGVSQTFSFDRAADRLVVGRPAANAVSLLDRSLFRDDFD